MEHSSKSKRASGGTASPSAASSKTSSQKTRSEGRAPTPKVEPVPVTHVLEAFRCSSCRKIVTPPISQCERGHPICPTCLGQPAPSLSPSRSKSCKTCSRPISPERNLALEGLADIVPFPCQFAPEGCPLFVHLSKKPAHEMACPFQLLACPFCAAMLKGSSRALNKHLGEVHTEVVVRKVPIKLPASTNRLKDAVRAREHIQEFTILRGEEVKGCFSTTSTSTHDRRHGHSNYPERSTELLILTVMTRPDHDQILYMMQIFRATARAGTPLRYRLPFAKDDVSTLSYAGVVHPYWVTKKEEIADRGECLSLPCEFFLNSLFGGALEVELIG